MKRHFVSILAGLALASSAWPARAQNMFGERERQMAHCPSAVATASSRIIKTDDGYELTVTARGVDAIRELRVRARSQVDERPAAPGPPHTGKGTDTGSMGYCPVVRAGTKVKVTDIEGGVVISVKAIDRANVTDIQSIAKSRLDAFMGEP